MKQYIKWLSLLLIPMMSTVSHADNNNNPYSFFSGNSGTATTANSAASSTNTNKNKASASKQTTVNMPASQSPNIQYVQPASQVGQFNTNSSTQANFKSTAKGSGAQPALQSLSSGPSSLGTAYQQDNPSIPSNIPDMTVTNNYLKVIADSTNAMNQNTNDTNTDLNLLSQYWTQDLSSSPFVSQTAGYDAVKELNSMNSVINDKKTKLPPESLPDLTGNFSPDAKGNYPSVTSAIPYLSELTRDATANTVQYGYWGPSVQNTLFDLSTSRPEIESLHQATLVPFGGQSDWQSQVQSASTPQLLRALVVEQAIQNELLYQNLKMQQDQALMQASELRMLRETLQSIKMSNTEQASSQRRLVRAIEESSGKTGVP